MNGADPAVQAASFGAAAGAYQRARPSYPPVAVDWLLPPGVRRVLDLGAGTGQLTRVVAECGLEVTAVEPSVGMREQMARVLPGVPVLAGSGEDLPVPDASVEVVLAAQAWHWVDPVRAVPEAARVLRPDSRLGLVWNNRDERIGWVAALGDLMRRSTHGVEQDMRSKDPPVGPPFAPVQRLDVPWSHQLIPRGLLDLVASRSCVITLPGAQRADLLHAVEHLVATHPDLAGRGVTDLPYVTRCSRTTTT